MYHIYVFFSHLLDLSVIENMWANLKYHIRKNMKPINREELIKGICDYWSKLSPETCRKYIQHVHKVIPAVIASKGGPTEYYILVYSKHLKFTVFSDIFSFHDTDPTFYLS